MAVTESFLATCRTAIELLPELTTFRDAYSSFDTCSRNDKGLYWHAAYGDAQSGLSPAYRLRAAIRETVRANGGSVTAIDQESAYQTLVGQYVPNINKPIPADQEQAELQRILLEDLMS